MISYQTHLVVIALVKLENLKANHNYPSQISFSFLVVIALSKIENLKANHNSEDDYVKAFGVVIALVKLENLRSICKLDNLTMPLL